VQQGEKLWATPMQEEMLWGPRSLSKVPSLDQQLYSESLALPRGGIITRLISHMCVVIPGANRRLFCNLELQILSGDVIPSDIVEKDTQFPSC
jgi:hypothetical protein